MSEPPFIRNDIYRGPEGGDVSYYLQNVMGAQRSQGSRLHGTQGVVQRCSAWMDKGEYDRRRGVREENDSEDAERFARMKLELEESERAEMPLTAQALFITWRDENERFQAATDSRTHSRAD